MFNMQTFPPTIILRHRKENLKKCSLRGLEGRDDFIFYTYPIHTLPDISDCIILSLDAPPLTSDDADRGLFILDGTWRYAEKMCENTPKLDKLTRRSLPGSFRTAYPRIQEDCPDPRRGLASIEAIYIAYRILGRDTTGLLDNYYWKDDFLRYNHL